MIKQLLATELLGPLVRGLLGESVGYVPPPPPPPPQVPQGTVTFQSPTTTDTTISQPLLTTQQTSLGSITSSMMEHSNQPAVL